MNNVPSLISAMRAKGLNPPQHLKANSITRFPGQNKGSNNTSAWCWLSPNQQHASFGDWSTGQQYNWSSNARQPASNHKTRPQKQVPANKRGEQDSLAVTEKAQAIWRKARPISAQFQYLIKKGVASHNARIYKNTLVLPIIDFHQQLHGLQFIQPDGTKRFLKGTKKRGHFIPLTNPQKPVKHMLICEGWATACTLSDMYRDSHIIAAIDASNLMSVAINARHYWPQLPICIAGDDDRLTHGNPGATKARAAAARIRASIILPQWPNDAPKDLTDFNDLAQWQREHSA